MRRFFANWFGGTPRRGMPASKVPCKECGAMILPQTAKASDGYCAGCASLGAEGRAARFNQQSRIDNGAIYWPSDAEFAASRKLDVELNSTQWRLEPEVYRSEGQSLESELARVDDGEELSLILRCEHDDAVEGRHLVLEVKGPHGACFFVDTNHDAMYFAHTARAASGQIEADEQLSYCCPCCGVGMGTVPSRFHLSREEARGILVAAARRVPQSVDVRWIESDDLSRYAPGQG